MFCIGTALVVLTLVKTLYCFLSHPPTHPTHPPTHPHQQHTHTHTAASAESGSASKVISQTNKKEEEEKQRRASESYVTFGPTTNECDSKAGQEGRGHPSNQPTSGMQSQLLGRDLVSVMEVHVGWLVDVLNRDWKWDLRSNLDWGWLCVNATVDCLML